jgi:hypothetical protein
MFNIDFCFNIYIITPNNIANNHIFGTKYL